MSDAIINPTPESEAELAFEGALRPTSLSEFVGQSKVRGQLQLLLQVSRRQAAGANTILVGIVEVNFIGHRCCCELLVIKMDVQMCGFADVRIGLEPEF